MADLASLKINVDSRAVKSAVTDLAVLARESGNAEGSLKRLGVASAVVGAAFAAGFLMAARSAVAFQKSIAEISTLVDNAVISVDDLSATVRNQANEFGGDVQTQAKALYQIISAGASDAAAANNILTISNKLAVGGVTDVATAADGLTSVLNAYGDRVAGATAVSDAMFIAMKAGKTTIGELSASIGTVAPLAAQMGISFDELTASTAALTKGGVSTSVAVTGLRAILATIAKPSKEASDLAAELGIQFNSAGLQANGLAGFMEDLKQKTGGSSDAMATLFGGVEALVPALALSGQAGKDLAVIMEQMRIKTGATDEAVGKMAQTFDFQFRKAIANINDLILSLGIVIQNTLLPALTFFNKNLDTIISTLKMVGFALIGATTAFVGLQAALGVKAIIGFIVQIYALIAGMGIANFATVAATFAINAFKVALASTGIGIVVVAIGALVGAMYSLSTAQSAARDETNRLIGSLASLAAARSKDFKSKFNEAKQAVATDKAELDRLMTVNRSIEAASRQSGMTGKQTIAYNKNNEAIGILNQTILTNKTRMNEASQAYNDAGVAATAQGAASQIAATDTKKSTDKSTDALMDYYKGLIETGKYLGFNTEYEKQAAKARDAGRNSLAANIILQGKANDAAQLRDDFIKGTLDDLLFENSLIGKNTQEREQAIAARALENAQLVKGTAEYEKYLAAVAASSQGKVTDEQEKRITALTNEIDLMKLTTEEAIKQAAVFEALALGYKVGSDEFEKFIANATKQAGLEKVRDGLKEIADAMQEVKDMTFDIDLDGVFGNVGKAVGGLVNVFDDYAKRQKTLDTALKGYAKGSVERSKAELKSFRNEINLYGNLAASAKGFFKEKSVGYKVMQAAETAFRAFEFAMSLKAMAMNTAEATSTVATEATKTAAQTASGASKMFSQLGMWAFPVVAAMIAVMASLGGKGGSVSQPSIPSAEDMQAQQGAGSVLGDSTAKSDSINRALEIMASNSNSDLEYSNQMLLSLRSIQSNMANLSNNVAKQISLSGGMFDTSGQRLGSSGSGGFLGMFASSTTRELHDLGIDIVSSSIAEIIAGGVSGNTYQVVEQVKKKSGFFGLGGGTKTTYQTTTGSIDQDVRNSITGVVASLRQGLIDGAAVIGLDGAQAILDNFQVSIGKISLSGLTGQEIEEQLNAIFSKVGDQMAGALLPSLTEMQKIGEGLFETFARVAREYQVVDVALRSIGKEFGAVGIASVAARSALVQMFESLDQFVEQTNYFRDNFLTEAEQLAPITKAVADELQRLGLSSISTIEQFKMAVLGLDLTTTAGQEAYFALLQLAPAFKKVADAQTEIAEKQLAEAKAIADAAEKAAKAAQDIQNKRVSMEIQLMDAQGNASGALAARRTLELAAMDESLRALQNQIYAAQDAKAAADAAAQSAKVAAEENARQLAAAAKLSNDRRELEIQLLEAQGNAVEALAARRAIELEAMDESLVAIKMQIWAAQAKAAADAEAAKIAEEGLKVAQDALDLAQRRRVLEIDLMDALGNSTEALAARRVMELEAIDETLRGLQLQIWAAQDAAIATQQLAEAQQKAAEEAQRIAEAAISLARDRRSLEIDLLEALGNSTEALVQRRELELASIDETLRGLQTQIWAAQDAREASVAAAEAAKAAAEEQAEQLEFVAALAIKRRELEIELLEAQGFAVEALAARRAMELEGMDASLVGLKEQIWAAKAKAEADELASKVAQERADTEAKALEDAAQAAQKYQDALSNVTQTVVDEINRLRGINVSSSSALLKAQFASLTAQARTGNLDALGKLPELSRSIEEATLGTATSALEVARIRAWLDASLSETLAQQGASSSMLDATSAGLTFDGNSTASANAEQTSGELSNMSNVLYTALYQVAKNTGKSYELLDRWDGDGLPDIREDASDYY